jgi:hypothetical protein
MLSFKELGSLSGWIHKPAEVDLYCNIHKPFQTVGSAIIKDGKGETVLLHKALLAVRKSWPYYVQTIGDCVGHGYARASMILMACEIYYDRQKEVYAGDISSEVVYGLSRVEIGRGQLGNDDGSVGAWGAEAVKMGVVLRRFYTNSNANATYDLRDYNPELAKTFGYKGVPDMIEEIGKKTPIKTASLCKTYEEARAALANHFPVVVCSGQGFVDKRDKDGFCRPSGSWAHCMVFLGVDDNSKRPGLLCDNTSWGHYTSGPKRFQEDQEGMFWVDADTADKMLRNQPDSYAVSNFIGFPKRSFKDLAG